MYLPILATAILSVAGIAGAVDTSRKACQGGPWAPPVKAGLEWGDENDNHYFCEGGHADGNVLTGMYGFSTNLLTCTNSSAQASESGRVFGLSGACSLDGARETGVRSMALPPIITGMHSRPPRVRRHGRLAKTLVSNSGALLEWFQRPSSLMEIAVIKLWDNKGSAGNVEALGWVQVLQGGNKTLSVGSDDHSGDEHTSDTASKKIIGVEVSYLTESANTLLQIRSLEL
jgi:hypothetical protein